MKKIFDADFEDGYVKLTVSGCLFWPMFFILTFDGFVAGTHYIIHDVGWLFNWLFGG